jgi:hypothetical protein
MSTIGSLILCSCSLVTTTPLASNNQPTSQTPKYASLFPVSLSPTESSTNAHISSNDYTVLPQPLPNTNDSNLHSSKIEPSNLTSRSFRPNLPRRIIQRNINLSNQQEFPSNQLSLIYMCNQCPQYLQSHDSTLRRIIFGVSSTQSHPIDNAVEMRCDCLWCERYESVDGLDEGRFCPFVGNDVCSF